MANHRIFFGCRALGIAPYQTTNYYTIHGARAAGIDLNINLQNVQELGQLDVYQLVEQIPEVEVSAEKVLDGNTLIYHAATFGSPDGSLVGRSNQRCMISLPVYNDAQGAASGTPISETIASGMYPSQLTYTFGTENPFTEALTFVGNEVLYQTSNFSFAPTGFLTTDNPLALAGSGGVQMRYHFVFYPILGGSDPNHSKETSGTLDGNGQVSAFLTILPPEVGVSSSGTNDRDATGNFLAHVSQITASVNLGRDTILELGRKLPYFRFVTWPVQTTTEITVTALSAMNIQATEAGLDGHGNDTVNRTIKIRTTEGTWIDMGTQNRLNRISARGGDTDGGNTQLTYSYLNYNHMLVSHPQDPSLNGTSIVWPY